MHHVLDAGIIVPNEKKFIRSFVKTYLETHPQIGLKPVTDELVEEWVTTVYYFMFVSTQRVHQIIQNRNIAYSSKQSFTLALYQSAV